jgi:hypothetical protein
MISAFNRSGTLVFFLRSHPSRPSFYLRHKPGLAVPRRDGNPALVIDSIGIAPVFPFMQVSKAQPAFYAVPYGEGMPPVNPRGYKEAGMISLMYIGSQGYGEIKPPVE